jgi:hypothetical protein
VRSADYRIWLCFTVYRKGFYFFVFGSDCVIRGLRFWVRIFNFIRLLRIKATNEQTRAVASSMFKMLKRKEIIH